MRARSRARSCPRSPRAGDARRVPTGPAKRCAARRGAGAGAARPWRLYVVHSSGDSENGRRRNPGEGRRSALEAPSSAMRLAPSTGAQSPNGIPRPALPCPRMHKRGPEHRLRGSRLPPSPGGRMRFAGIDIASATHVLAIIGADGAVELKATPFGEDAAGYQKALALLGTPDDLLIAMEATGHYWKNLFAALTAAGHQRGLAQPAAHASLRQRGSRNAPRPTPSTRSASRASRPRNDRRPRACPIAPPKNCASSCGCASGCCKTSAIACASCIAWSISASPNSPATCAASRANWPAPSCTTTPTPPPCTACRCGGWRHCATTDGIKSASISPVPSSMPRAIRWATITARPTASKSATPARTSTRCAAACAISIATSKPN